MLLTLKLAIASLVFATGLSATREDLFWIWRHPNLLARSFLAMYVLVPLVAIAMTLALDLPRATKIGLLFLSISAGAPLLPRKLIKLGGDPSYVFSLVVATSLAAILTVPASLALLQPLLPVEADIDIGRVAATILKTFLLPLAAGMALREFAIDWAERLGDPPHACCRCAADPRRTGVYFFQLASNRRNRATFAARLCQLYRAGLSHWTLAGRAGRGASQFPGRVLCDAAIGLALLIAANVRGPRTLALVAAYLFASALVCIPYIRWRRRAIPVIAVQ